MNQQQLQSKRRKRQAKRKQAQVSARRRAVAEGEARDRAASQVRARPERIKPVLVSQGTQVTPDQMDTEAAPIVGGGR